MPFLGSAWISIEQSKGLECIDFSLIVLITLSVSLRSTSWCWRSEKMMIFYSCASCLTARSSSSCRWLTISARKMIDVCFISTNALDGLWKYLWAAACLEDLLMLCEQINCNNCIYFLDVFELVCEIGDVLCNVVLDWFLKSVVSSETLVYIVELFEIWNYCFVGRFDCHQSLCCLHSLEKSVDCFLCMRNCFDVNIRRIIRRRIKRKPSSEFSERESDAIST